MSGQQNDESVTAEAPVTASGAEPAAPARAPRRRRRTVFALAGGGLGLALLAGAGLWAAEMLDAADRTAPTQYWAAAGDDSTTPTTPAPTVPPNALVARLLPLPRGYEAGPDLDEEGNDFYVSGERAAESFKGTRTGLSAKERGERDKALAELKLKGLAGRSYLAGNGVVSGIHLTQADPAALASFSDFAKKLLGMLGEDREAPKIEGFPEARCALYAVVDEEAKAKDKGKIDSLECVAVEGDVLVTFRTYGTTDFVKKSADLFTQQLKHLKSPGESA
ncbi:hypothetical protein KPP03845_104129 [Streptomyces xanthophaeus]|uniref:hypothetical protein n=1 Tax=Streptomyces xanthophaeus TaxID=67385 RepID=UPI00233F31F4|nr:hypothetical protein [Streptomyces xanthophaeus]WCD87729.1 hypothetical protein KPP03845_104129 [Streptomyces xanthophaeus]